MTTRDRRLDRAIALAVTLSESARKDPRGAPGQRLEPSRCGTVGRDLPEPGRPIRAWPASRHPLGAALPAQRGCRTGSEPSILSGLGSGSRYRAGTPARARPHPTPLLGALAHGSPALRAAGLSAWDAVLDATGCTDGFEAETRLADLQAIERRILLKLRDDQTIRHVVLVVADTKANRRALTVGREGLRRNFPLDTRAAMSSLSAGRCPGRNAVVLA